MMVYDCGIEFQPNIINPKVIRTSPKYVTWKYYMQLKSKLSFFTRVKGNSRIWIFFKLERTVRGYMNNNKQSRGFPCGSDGKESAPMWETWVRSLGWEDLLEKGKATHSSILAWRIPWTVVHGVAKSQTWLSLSLYSKTYF